MYANGAGPQSVPEVFTGAPWLFVVKPFQIRPSELLQPHVPTLTGVGGVLGTSCKSKLCVPTATFVEFLLNLTCCHSGPMRMKRGKCNLETALAEIKT